MTNINTYNQTITEAVEVIKRAILQSQCEASKDVNRVQLSLYYGVGRYISQNSRQQKWGTGAIDKISDLLSKSMPGLRGFSATNLKLMRIFYEEWRVLDTENEETEQSSHASNVNELTIRHMQVTNFDENMFNAFLGISFSHHRYILQMTKSEEERHYYIRLAYDEKLSVESLKKAIKTDEYHHRGTIPSNFCKTMSSAEQAFKTIMMFKDAYQLDFINTEELGVRDIEDIDERVVEQEIVHNIKHFMMTFGKDFAFVGNQQNLKVFGKEHFPDLIFFNRELNALVVIELKKGEFKSAYLGQLTTYLRLVNDQMRKPHENPPIGIVLCTKADSDYVQYVIQDFANPMGVATYHSLNEMPEQFRNALPDIGEMRKLL